MVISMNRSLLKKVAIQSVALMIAVITFSYALNQYKAVTIEAVSQPDSILVGNTATSDAVPNNEDTKDQVIELTAGQKLITGADLNILEHMGDNFIVIKKPEGENLSLSLEDLYINKSIQLTLTGMADNDYRSDRIARIRGDELFSGNPKYINSTTTKVDEEDGTTVDVEVKDYGNDISHGITITTSQDDQTQQYTAQILIELDSVYVYKVYEDANNFYIKLQKPSDVYDKIVVIDAGHGGKDGGASSRDGSILEKNMNLDIAMDLKKLLDNENIKAYYTRTKDETVYLRPRAELANAVDCDYFISIHCNANDVSSPNGSEVLYYDNDFKGIRNLDLAKLFAKEMGKAVPLENKGTIQRHKNDLYIMDKSLVPMILIEVGYLTNKGDMDYLSKADNRKAIAQGIYNGIMKAYEELPVSK
jgi:N-acetylmuramoyl-L-alanine amidase